MEVNEIEDFKYMWIVDLLVDITYVYLYACARSLICMHVL